MKNERERVRDLKTRENDLKNERTVSTSEQFKFF